MRAGPQIVDTTLPSRLFETIVGLCHCEDVKSISVPFDDYALWRSLIEEQCRRASETGQDKQRALGLFGPESGLGCVPVAEWGGEVHIPYEGACGADLFVVPSWHRFFADKIRAGGKLRHAIHKPCNRVIVKGDHGEVACASRTEIGDGWWLYTWTAPHEDCNPIFESVEGRESDASIELE